MSGSFQGFDQSYLVAALDALGPTFVGVTQIPADTSDDQIRDLDAAGVRAVRFNARRGGSAGLDELDRLARRVYDVAGWHTELYIDARGTARTRRPDPRVARRERRPPRAARRRTARAAPPGRSRVKVKATGFGRVALDPAAAVAAIMAVDPTALMFGTDLPSTRARRPFADQDIDLLASALDPSQRDAALWGNAAALYLARPRTA